MSKVERLEKYTIGDNFIMKKHDETQDNADISEFFDPEDLFKVGMTEEEFVKKYQRYAAIFIFNIEKNETDESYDLSSITDEELADIEEVAKIYFDSVDKNDDGVISEEEIEEIASRDGDSESISDEDLKSLTLELFSEEAEETEVEDIDEVEPSNTISSGGGGGGGGGSYSPAAQSTQNADNSPKTLDKMTKEELQTELSSAKTELGTKQKELNSIFDGSNSDLAALKEKENSAYEAYQNELKEVEPEMAQQLDMITDKISKKDEEINNQEKIIADLEQSISNINAEYLNAKSSVTTLESALSALKSTDTKELTSEQSSELSSKISSTESQLKTAKDKVTKLEEEIREKEKNLAEYKDNLNNVLKPEKEELVNQKEKLEAQILEKHPEISELIDAYNNAKSDYEKTKAEMISSAKADLDKALDSVHEIEAAISKVDDNKNVKENLTFSTSQTLDDIFDGSVTGYEMKQFNYNGRNYLAYVPEGVDPNEEMPLLIYLHGSGEKGTNTNELLSSDQMYLALKDMAADSSYENFKGIILFPQAKSGWNDSELARLDGLVNDFINNKGYNINQDKISLTGFSMGGSGVGSYYNYSGRTVSIYRAAVLAGFNANMLDNMYANIPVRVYTGSKDSGPQVYREHAGKLGLTEKNNINLTGVGHGGTPRATIFRDGAENDKNGRSDFFEFLWGDD